ncbi:hypothetical protein V2G26_016237 [Clonostachys chloroleuca]
MSCLRLQPPSNGYLGTIAAGNIAGPLLIAGRDTADQIPQVCFHARDPLQRHPAIALTSVPKAKNLIALFQPSQATR